VQQCLGDVAAVALLKNRQRNGTGEFGGGWLARPEEAQEPSSGTCQRAALTMLALCHGTDETCGRLAADAERARGEQREALLG
jgi:hypothetical protein